MKREHNPEGDNCFENNAVVMQLMSGAFGDEHVPESDDAPPFVFVIGDTQATKAVKAKYGRDVRAIHCWLEAQCGDVWTTIDMSASEEWKGAKRDDYYRAFDVGETYRVTVDEWADFVALCEKAYGGPYIGPPPYGEGPWDWEIVDNCPLVREGKIKKGHVSLRQMEPKNKLVV